MLTIYVDADACPVKEEVYRVARRYAMRVAVVANNPLWVPVSPLVELVVRTGFGAADDWIAEQCGPGDIAITADIPLAARCVVKGALVLDPKGRPSVTERVFVIPPGSQIGPITPEQRKALIAGSLVAGVYEKAVDKESAYEKLKGRAAASADRAQEMQAEAENATKAPRPLPGRQPAPPQDDGGMLGGLKDVLFGSIGPRGGKREGLAESAARSAMRSVGSAVGREIIRGVLGGLLGGSRRR